MRGAGTSIAGNAVGPGIVVDTVRHLNRVVSVDPEARTAVVQPGVVHATLQRAAAAARAAVRAGPVHAHPLHGRRHDRQQRLRVAGARLRPDRRQRGRAAGGVRERRGDDRGTGLDRLDRRWHGGRLVDGHLAHVRQSFGRFSRQVSGYSLEHLLPENGPPPRPVPGRLRGHPRPSSSRRPSSWSPTSRGGWWCSATRRWPRPPTRCRRCWPRAERLVACEGLDARIVDLVRAAGGAVPELPRGDGWLFVETGEGGSVPRRRRAGAARDRRPGRGRRAVADPRGRRRAGGAQPGPAGVLRLGGRRRPARAARRLAARLRRAPGGARAARRAVRPLRRRLRARADRLRVRRRRPAAGSASSWSPGPSALQAARRLAVRRARRRPGPLGAAAADVRRGVAAAVRRGQGDLRPGRPAQPRRAGRPGAGRRRPAPGPAARRRRPPRSGSPTTAARSATRCTAAPGSASASRTAHRPA